MYFSRPKIDEYPFDKEYYRIAYRELAEELGIQATIGLLYHQQHAVYPDSGAFDVFYYIVPSFQGNIVNHAFETYAWVPVRDLPSYDNLEGNRDVINKLLADDEIHQQG